MQNAIGCEGGWPSPPSPVVIQPLTQGYDQADAKAHGGGEGAEALDLGVLDRQGNGGQRQKGAEGAVGDGDDGNAIRSSLSAEVDGFFGIGFEADGDQQIAAGDKLHLLAQHSARTIQQNCVAARRVGETGCNRV